MIRIDPAVRLPLFLAISMVIVFVIGHAWENRIQAPREYSNECSICHHGGHGQVSEIAPIFGRVGPIAQTPAGHHYLVDVLLYGLDGPITAGGGHYNGAMPSFQRLPNDEIARILTFVASQEMSGSTPIFTAADVAAARTHPMSASEVLQERQKLDLQTPVR
ncbi:c-type cytochrome [Gluconobacter aidae]|uniref:Cytochrome c n=1 Tax=Gluconobacter aidae TaxID=2662454 RepID=A0A7X1SP30_9PROT|nr:cytochrome c [Gluconobacter aidae]MQR97985.1 cytochrome c [Gluconobacter aidae]